jgi:hypothetical protein
MENILSKRVSKKAVTIGAAVLSLWGILSIASDIPHYIHYANAKVPIPYSGHELLHGYYNLGAVVEDGLARISVEELQRQYWVENAEYSRDLAQQEAEAAHDVIAYVW